MIQLPVCRSPEQLNIDTLHSPVVIKITAGLLSSPDFPGCGSNLCVLQLRGVRPFLSDKYDLTQHPNYKYTADYDKKLTFDIEKYLSTRAKLHPKDEFFVMKAEN